MLHYLFVAIVDFALCIAALMRKDNSAAKSVALTAFCIGLWSLELFFLSFIKNTEYLSPLFHLTRTGLFFIPLAFAYFVYQILNSKSRLYRNFILYPGLLVCSWLSFLNIFIIPSELVVANDGYLPKPDFIYHTFLIIFSYLLGSSIVYCVASYSKSTQREKQKIKSLLFSLVSLTTFGWIAAYLFTASGYLSQLVPAFVNVLFILTFFYISTDNRIMNIRFSMMEGLVKLLLLASYIVFYFLVVDVVRTFSSLAGNFLFVFIFVLLVTHTYNPALQLLLRWLKRHFSNVKYDLREQQERMQIELNDVNNLEEIYSVLDVLFLQLMELRGWKLVLVADFQSNLNFRSSEWSYEQLENDNLLVKFTRQNAGIILRDEVPSIISTEIKMFKGEAIFPIFHERDIVALVAVGYPKNINYFRYEELQLFQWLTKTLERVIARIIHYQKMNDELIESRKTLSLIGVMNQYHHDIKTPLSIIDGVISTDIYDKEKQREIVIEQVERGTRLIATMAGILRGKRTRKVMPLMLENIIRDSVFVFENRFNEVKLEFAQVDEIAGDAIDLKILFVNLIKNAVEAADANRPICLTVKLSQESNLVTTSIVDTGIGMDEDQLRNLWTLESSIKPHGNGLGLQTIRRIADEHDAKINVTSEVGKGTEFVLHFASSMSQPHVSGANK